MGVRFSRSAVVTGASSGIGLACALRLAEAGFRVFAGIHREEPDSLRRLSVAGLTPMLFDVTDPLSIADAARSVSHAVGPNGLNILVNNAGMVVPGSLGCLPIAEIRRQFEVNVFGQLAVTQAFLPLIRIATGRIVNIGSTGGRVAMPFIAPYNASKFG